MKIFSLITLVSGIAVFLCHNAIATATNDEKSIIDRQTEGVRLSLMSDVKSGLIEQTKPTDDDIPSKVDQEEEEAVQALTIGEEIDLQISG